MKKVVLLLAVLLGSFSFANANTIKKQPNAAKEVKVHEMRRHKKAKKAAQAAVKPAKAEEKAKK
jgi:hypothetical protein